MALTAREIQQIRAASAQAQEHARRAAADPTTCCRFGRESAKQQTGGGKK